jgi:DNA-binding transcriptional ArsR family regulator
MLEEEAIKQAVKVYKALGEPTRLRIVILLAEENCPLNCHDIGTKLGIPGSTLSHHLKQLMDCGLLESRKDGTYIYCSLNRELAKQYMAKLVP